METLTRRHQTLSRLGVSLWFSRKTLTGAADSPEFVTLSDVIEESGATPEGNAESSFTTSGVESSAASLLAGLKITEELVSESTGREALAKRDIVDTPLDSAVSASPTQIAPVSSEPVGAFYLRGYRSGQYVVITQSADNVPSLKEVALLRSILKACRLKSEVPVLNGSFTWPVFNSSTMLGNDAGLLATLLSRWLAEQRYGDAKFCFLFGSCFEAWKESFRIESDIVIHLDASLADMLSMPARKSVVWRQLIPHLSLINKA